jgi:membrane peptidoglycan carboxypeptidase
MSARPRRTGSAVLGVLGIAVVAGLMLTVGVMPAIGLTSANAKGGTGLFAPLPDDLKISNLQQKTEIYAKSGSKNVLLASFYNQNRDVIEWSDVPATVKNATLGAEDPRFYDHGGVDPMGILSAVVNNVLHHSSRGASTISQQYVKNVCIQEAELLPTQAKVDAAYAECTGGVQRKLREARYAIGLEKQYTKDEILLNYLNIAGFGGRIYGIESAAHYYYDTPTKDLTIAQAASLMAIVNNPNYLRIDVKANLPANKARRDYVLGVELKYKMITRAEYDAAVKTPVTPKITPTTTGCAGAKSAAYFCDYVVNVVKNDKAFGATDGERYNRLQSGGWKIYTTLDMALQKKASTAMKTYVSARSPEGTNIGGAAVSVEAGTGRIISMVQSKRYDDTGGKGTSGAGYTATAVNYNTDEQYGGSIGFQPGSTYKTFTLIDWLEAGHGLYESVNGSPRTEPAGTFKCADPDGPWQVGNDTADEGGYQTVMSATARSVNGAYASMAEKLSLCDLKKTAEDLGVHRADGAPLETNPSSVLGTNLIAPLTMASAYGAIANKGKVCNAVAIDKIVSTNGDVDVPKADCTDQLAESVAVATGYALHGVLTGGTAAADSGATGGAWGFAKTGTTDEAKSTWVVGGTTKTVTAAWVGNVSGNTNLRQVLGYAPCQNGSAANARHCLWSDIVAANTAKYGGDASWPQPDTKYLYGQKVAVPDVTGKSVRDAKRTLQAAGFQVKTGGATTSDVQAGAVAGTDPAAGTSVPSGALVTLTTSSGPAPVAPPTAPAGTTVAMPNVSITMTLGQALGTLSQAGFTNVQLQSTPTGANTCRVLAQNPAFGTPADPTQTQVTLNVDGDTNACQQQ